MGSKSKIVLSIIVAIFIVGLTIYKISPPKYATLSKNATPTPAQQIVTSITEKDSDSDGLKDWEESLWGTDPKNPDTDGDGTLDGEEVKLNRNPLIPNTAPAGQAPNDKIDSVAANLENQKTNTATADLTATDRFAQDLFAKYMSLKQQGQPLDEQSKEALVNSVLNDTPVPVYKTFELKDIKTVNTGDKTVIKDYGNSIGVSIAKNSPKNSENELDILRTALVDDNPDELTKLDPIIDGYKGIIKDLLALPAPQSLASNHLSLLNSIGVIEQSIEAMKNGYKDPIGVLAIMNDYLKKIDDLKLSVTNLKITFSGLGISFSQQDPGYLLVNSL